MPITYEIHAKNVRLDNTNDKIIGCYESALSNERQRRQLDGGSPGGTFVSELLTAQGGAMTQNLLASSALNATDLVGQVDSVPVSVAGRTLSALSENSSVNSVAHSQRGRMGSGADTLGVMTRSGFWSQYLLKPLERITGGKKGAEVVCLPSETLLLDPPAEILLTHYIDYLNTLLLEQGVGPNATESEELNNKYAVVRELLIRLVSIALSNNLDTYHDGDSLIQVLNTFTTELAKKELLLKKSMLNARVSKFLANFATTHERWVKRITTMVAIVKSINANRKAVSDTLDSLKSAQNKLQIQLAVFLDRKNVTADSLAENWSYTTWSRCESRCIEKFNRRSSGELATQKRSVQLLDEAILVDIIDKKVQGHKLPAAAKDKVPKLYNALQESEKLFEIFCQLDLLLTYTSWVPILMSVIRFEKLASLLEAYSEHCADALDFNSDELRTFLQKQGQPLVKYNATNGEGLRRLIMHSGERLSELDDLKLKRRVGRLIESALSSLITAQASLPESYHFMDKAQLQICQASLSTPKEAQPTVGHREETSISVNTDEPNQLQTPEQTISLNALEATIGEKNRRIEALNQEVELLRNQIAGSGKMNPSEVIATKMLHQLLIQETPPSLSLLNTMRQHGASLEALCEEGEIFQGYTALHIAVEMNNQKACEWILSRVTDVNIKDSQGETALDKACKKKSPKLINLLRIRGVHSKFAQDCTRELHRLIGEEQVTEADETVTPALLARLAELLEMGADINGVDENPTAWQGNRPLHTLLMKGNKRLIHWAMKNGANPVLKKTGQNREPETPLQYLERAAWNKEPTVRFLKENNYYPRFFNPQRAPATGDKSQRTQAITTRKMTSL